MNNLTLVASMAGLLSKYDNVEAVRRFSKKYDRSLGFSFRLRDRVVLAARPEYGTDGNETS